MTKAIFQSKISWWGFLNKLRKLNNEQQLTTNNNIQQRTTTYNSEHQQTMNKRRTSTNERMNMFYFGNKKPMLVSKASFQAWLWCCCSLGTPDVVTVSFVAIARVMLSLMSFVVTLPTVIITSPGCSVDRAWTVWMPTYLHIVKNRKDDEKTNKLFVRLSQSKH